nr:hypothetical protein [uncultured Cellulosilyticum sp.]
MLNTECFSNMNTEELIEVEGGGWLSVVGGGLIAAGAIVSGGGALVVTVGVAGGLLTAIAGA